MQTSMTHTGGFLWLNAEEFLTCFEGVSQRTISSSTGHSRNTVSDVVQRAKKLGVESLNDTMTNQWLEVFLFPEKQASEKGYFTVD
jgi:hypothetical protein